MATQPQVTEIIMMLADAYSKEFQNPKGYLETAARLLVNVPADELRRAAEAHIEASRFFPSIAELKAAIKRLPVLPIGPQANPDIMRARASERLADKNPAEWTGQDHGEFELIYGHPVWWKGAPIDTRSMVMA